MTTRTKKPATNGNGHVINAQQLAVFSELVDRMTFAGRHGLGYSGDRDFYAVGGYKKNLAFADYKDQYNRDGIAGQLVDRAPETTWREAPEVVEPDNAERDELSEFEKQWLSLAQRLNIWGVLKEADIWSRVGRYSVILIGAKGGDDQTLQRELTRLEGPDDVLFLSVFDEKQATIKTWGTNPTSERFLLPETYEIDFKLDIPNAPVDQTFPKRTVHWSRIIHVAEGNVFGRPVLQRVWNDLYDLQKVRTSSGEAFWQRVAGILHAQFPPDMAASDEQLAQLDGYLQEIYHDLRRHIYGNFDLKRLAADEPNPEPAARLCMQLISAGATPPIPMRLLFGSETGERASTEDQKTWYGAIQERREQYAEPMILRAFIDRLMQFNALPRPAEYTIVWPPLFQESEKEIAEANRARAEAAKALAGTLGNPMDLVEIDEERRVWLRPTGERGELSAEEMEPPEPEPVTVPDPDAAGA